METHIPSLAELTQPSTWLEIQGSWMLWFCGAASLGSGPRDGTQMLSAGCDCSAFGTGHTYLLCVLR